MPNLTRVQSHFQGRGSKGFSGGHALQGRPMPATPDMVRARSALSRALRDGLEQRGYLEVEMMARAGASMVVVMGVAHPATVRAAS